MPTKTRPPLKHLEAALAALRQTAGLDGRVVRMETAQTPRHTADALVEFAVAGRKHRFAVEAKATLDRAEALWPLKARLEQLKHPGIVFVPYVTDTIARKCRELDVPFIDGVGNAYLKRPGLYLFITGQRPKRRHKPSKACTGAGHGGGPPYGFRLAVPPQVVECSLPRYQGRDRYCSRCGGTDLRRSQEAGLPHWSNPQAESPARRTRSLV